MSDSPSEEQGSDNAEREAREEEHQRETDQLSKLEQQQHWATPSLLGCCNLYIAFVAALAAFAALAYYTNHQTILQITFFILVPLLAIVPIGVFVWLCVLVRHIRLIETIRKSPRFLAILHLADKRAFRLINFGIAIDELAYSILDVLPVHPQVAIVQIAFFTLALSVYIASEITRPITKEIAALWEQNRGLIEIIKSMNNAHYATREELVKAFRLISATQDLFISSSDRRIELDDAFSEAIKSTNAAVSALYGLPRRKKKKPRGK